MMIKTHQTKKSLAPTFSGCKAPAAVMAEREKSLVRSNRSLTAAPTRSGHKATITAMMEKPRMISTRSRSRATDSSNVSFSSVSARSKLQAMFSSPKVMLSMAALFAVAHGATDRDPIALRQLVSQGDGRLVGGALGWAHKSNVKKGTVIPKWTRRYWTVEPQTEENGLVTMTYFSDDRCRKNEGSFTFLGKSVVLQTDHSQANLWPGLFRITKGHKEPEGRGIQITGTLPDGGQRKFHLSFEDERTFRDFLNKMQQYGISQQYAPSRGGIGRMNPFAQAAAAAAKKLQK